MNLCYYFSSGSHYLFNIVELKRAPENIIAVRVSNLNKTCETKAAVFSNWGNPFMGFFPLKHLV